MTTTTNEAIGFWAEAIREQGESGLTVAEYCQLIEKSPYQFYYWKRRVRNDATKTYSMTKLETRDFIEIPRARFAPRTMEALSDYVDIQVGSFTIRFTERTDRSVFTMAASILQEIAG